MTYMLVFSVSYLETGLKMVFLHSDANRWARYFLYFMYLPCLAYLLGHSFAQMTFPVFRPGDVTNEECEATHTEWLIAEGKVLAINLGPTNLVIDAFNTLNTVVAAIGVSLIFVANRRISRSNS